MAQEYPTYTEKFTDFISDQIGGALKKAADRHYLPDELYVVISEHDGTADQIFTALYALSNQDDPLPGKRVAVRQGGVNLLRPGAAIETHLKKVLQDSPNTAFIMDDATASTLTPRGSGLSMVDMDGQGHWTLIGLREQPVVVYI